MIDNVTDGVQAAIARILTAFVTTGQIEGTFFVSGAFGSFATDQWIASETFWTITTSFVVAVRPTEGVQSARRVRAWVYAISVNAGVYWCTIGVGTATDFHTGALGVTGETVATNTDGAMKLGTTLCILTTRGAGAWVLTAVVDTSFVISTV